MNISDVFTLYIIDISLSDVRQLINPSLSLSVLASHNGEVYEGPSHMTGHCKVCTENWVSAGPYW